MTGFEDRLCAVHVTALDTVYLDQAKDSYGGLASEHSWREKLVVFVFLSSLAAILFLVGTTLLRIGLSELMILFVPDYVGFTEEIGNVTFTTNLTLTVLGCS